MDTSAKKFKYSRANKIICVLLCLLTFTGSAGLIASVIASVDYRCSFPDNTITNNWMDSNKFLNTLESDVSSAVRLAYNQAYKDDLEAQLNAKKDEVVEEVYNRYLENKAYAEKYYFNEGYIYNDDTEAETTIAISGDYLFNDISIAVYENDFYGTVYFNTGSYNIFEGCMERHGKAVEDVERQYIEELYDSFVYDESYCDEDFFYYEYCPSEYTYSLRLYAEYNGNIMGNTEYSPDTARSYPCYYIYENGEAEYNGIPQDVAEHITDNVLNCNEYSKDTTVCLYFVSFPRMYELLLSPGMWNDHYIPLEKFHIFARSIWNSALAVASAIAMAIISFVSGFYFFKITGKKSENEPVVLCTVDKLPVEIHFLISFAIGVAAWCLWAILIGYLSVYPYSVLFLLDVVLISVVTWALLFEFCASASRCIRSDKSTKECFAVYKLGKLIAKLFGRVKSIFEYKPAAMNKKTIVLTALYFAGNFAWLFAIMLCLVSGAAVITILGIVLIIPWVAVNAVIIAKVLKYIKNLDMIISAFNNRQEPQLNTDTLPKSLNMLAESMKYTNDELQSAISKALKDERLRSELITNVSHDLKTPLTSIINYVDLLSKCDINDEKAKEYIAVLDEKGAKLKRLIEDLIEASKVTSGNVTVNPTSINLMELTLQSTVEAQADFEKADLNLIVKECENPPVVTADGAKTYRIIENLLSNARKYSAKGSRVYVEVYDSEDYGVFEIKNISAQPLDISSDELTERFVRGDKSRNQEGNGLGLSIAKELCKLQRGWLELTIDGDLFKAKVKLPKA